MLGTLSKVAVGDLSSQGPVFFDPVTFHGDNTYPTGGTVGFQGLVRALFGDNRSVAAVIAQDCAGYRVTYDVASDRLKVLVAAGTEVPNTTDLSAVVFNLLVISN
jgi:hypothetical protein